MRRRPAGAAVITWLPALFAGAAVGVRWGLPGASAVRLSGVVPAGAPRPVPRRSGTRPPGPAHRARRRLTTELGWTLGLLAGAVAGLVAGGPAAAALAVLAGMVGHRAVTHARAAAAATEERRRAGEACQVLAAELRAGRAPVDALAEAAAAAVGRTGQILRSAASTARLGGDVPSALLTGGAVAPEVLRGLAVCWQVCATSGSGLSTAVGRLADGVRAQTARQRLLDEELAAPRATAGLLAVLPALGVLMGVGLGADPLHILLRTPFGLACLAAGVSLELLGLAWTQRLVANAAARP
jgi:tight adherence protein B